MAKFEEVTKQYYDIINEVTDKCDLRVKTAVETLKKAYKFDKQTQADFNKALEFVNNCLNNKNKTTSTLEVNTDEEKFKEKMVKKDPKACLEYDSKTLPVEKKKLDRVLGKKTAKCGKFESLVREANQNLTEWKNDEDDYNASEESIHRVQDDVVTVTKMQFMRLFDEINKVSKDKQILKTANKIFSNYQDALDNDDENYAIKQLGFLKELAKNLGINTEL